MGSKRKHTDISSDEVEVDTPQLPAQIPKKEIFDSSLLKLLCKDSIMREFHKSLTSYPAHAEAMQQFDNLLSNGTFDEDAYVAAVEKCKTPALLASAKCVRDTLMQKYPKLKEELTRFRAHPANKDLGHMVLVDKNLMLEIFKAQGVAVNTASGDGVEDIVRRAATTTDLVALKEAIETSPDKNRKDNEGRTALIIACYLGKAKCVEILLEAGVDMNARDKSVNTALHYAVAYSKNDCVELLLKHGADVTLRNTKGLTPIGVAEVTKKNELLELLKMHMPRSSDQVCLDDHA